MDEYFKKYNDLFEKFEKETGLKFKNEENRTDTITDDYVEWLESQVKNLSLGVVSNNEVAVYPNCKGTGRDGHDRCYPPNWYICEICKGSG